LSCLVFWVPRIGNILELFFSFYHLGRYPLFLYPSSIARLLMFGVPIAWATYFPARAMTGHGSFPQACLGAACAALAGGLLATALYRLGLQRYQSATS